MSQENVEIVRNTLRAFAEAIATKCCPSLLLKWSLTRPGEC